MDPTAPAQAAATILRPLVTQLTAILTALDESATVEARLAEATRDLETVENQKRRLDEVLPTRRQQAASEIAVLDEKVRARQASAREALEAVARDTTERKSAMTAHLREAQDDHTATLAALHDEIGRLTAMRDEVQEQLRQSREALEGLHAQFEAIRKA